MCKCVLPPGDNPIAVNKYIISYKPGITNAILRKVDTWERRKLIYIVGQRI
jgi:hypothetical protein